MLTLTDVADQRQHLLTQRRIESGKRFIQQQYRLGPNQLQLMLLFRRQPQPRIQPEANVLPYGQMAEEIIFLKQHGDRAARRRRVGMRLVFDRHCAAHRREKPGDQIQQRTFARAAWPQHRHLLTLLYGEGEAHRQMLIKPGDIIQF
ncbi:hypothetical protein GM30_08760 [Trabulsiella odontotermitis]|nr:hypothetical protein GM30_08760 [Trabulsiella odontotermitis]